MRGSRVVRHELVRARRFGPEPRLGKLQKPEGQDDVTPRHHQENGPDESHKRVHHQGLRGVRPVQEILHGLLNVPTGREKIRAQRGWGRGC